MKTICKLTALTLMFALGACTTFTETTDTPVVDKGESNSVPNYVWEIDVAAVDSAQVCKCTCGPAAVEIRHLPLVSNCRSYNGDTCEIANSPSSRLQGCKKTWVKK